MSALLTKLCFGRGTDEICVQLRTRPRPPARLICTASALRRRLTSQSCSTRTTSSARTRSCSASRIPAWSLRQAKAANRAEDPQQQLHPFILPSLLLTTTARRSSRRSTRGIRFKCRRTSLYLSPASTRRALLCLTTRFRPLIQPRPLFPCPCTRRIPPSSAPHPAPTRSRRTRRPRRLSCPSTRVYRTQTVACRCRCPTRLLHLHTCKPQRMSLTQRRVTPSRAHRTTSPAHLRRPLRDSPPAGQMASRPSRRKRTSVRTDRRYPPRPCTTPCRLRWDLPCQAAMARLMSLLSVFPRLLRISRLIFRGSLVSVVVPLCLVVSRPARLSPSGVVLLDPLAPRILALARPYTSSLVGSVTPFAACVACEHRGCQAVGQRLTFASRAGSPSLGRRLSPAMCTAS